jgi:AcrR family transcriptional regulator
VTIGIEGMAAPERRPRGRGHELRDDLLDAAFRLLAGLEDVEQLTMRAVAAEAGVTPPSLYRHFTDRAALVRALLGRGFAAFGRGQAESVTGIDDPTERLRASARAYVRFGIEHPATYRLLFATRHTGRPVAAAGLHPGQAALDGLHGFVSACLGPDAQEHATALAAGMWSTLHGYLELRAGKPDLPWPDPDDLVEMALAPVLHDGPPFLRVR